MESKTQKTPQVERNPPKITNVKSRNTTFNKVSSNSPSKRHSSGVIIRRRSFHGDGLLEKTKQKNNNNFEVTKRQGIWYYVRYYVGVITFVLIPLR